MNYVAKATLACCALAAVGPLMADESGDRSAIVVPLGESGTQNAVFWLESSLKRVFPQSPPGTADLKLLAARNSKIAFQVCFRNDSEQALRLTCGIEQADDLKPLVRLVGLTPVRHFALGTPPHELDGDGKFIPGLVPDPLWPQTSVEACPYESRSFWVTLTIPAQAEPGDREIVVRLTIKEGAQAVELPVRLTIAPLVLQDRRDFPVTHWWWPQSNWDYYQTGVFDERWWRITRAQLENMHEHGCDVVYVPMLYFTFPQLVEHPSQLLIVREPTPGNYQFDWSRVKRFTDLCREIGIRRFEWSHLWRNWTVAHPVTVYKLEQGKSVNLWPPDESALSPRFTKFMRQLLPEWKKFLDDEGLLNDSYFHLADEPHEKFFDNYRAAREFLHAEAPWLKVLDAVQFVRYGQQKLTDVPVCLLTVAPEYADAGIPHWVYFCCVPTGEYLNRFMDTPLAKIRMAGWTFYRLRAGGFLHWGFNYWSGLKDARPVNPFQDPTAAAAPGIPAGDPFVIYPGPDDRPLDSIRWEVFAESLQDYAMLQSAGISPDDDLLASIKSYQDFPKSEQWLDEARRKILLGPTAQPTTASGN